MTRSTPSLSITAALLLLGIVAFEIGVGAQVPSSSPARTPAGVPAPATAPATTATGCDATHATADLKKAGYVKYSLVDAGCEGKTGSEMCDKVARREKDSCSDDHTVTKLSCEKGAPKTEAKACPQGTRCHDGACK